MLVYANKQDLQFAAEAEEILNHLKLMGREATLSSKSIKRESANVASTYYSENSHTLACCAWTNAVGADS